VTPWSRTLYSDLLVGLGEDVYADVSKLRSTLRNTREGNMNRRCLSRLFVVDKDRHLILYPKHSAIDWSRAIHKLLYLRENGLNSICARLLEKYVLWTQ
jgi:hypothetical protein